MSLPPSAITLLQIDHRVRSPCRSWQQALMAAGLAKQIARCETPATGTVDYQDDYGVQQKPVWCGTSLLQDLKGAETALWDSIAGSEEGKSLDDGDPKCEVNLN